MSKALILIISFYQSFISAILKNILGINRMCRFSPTCSEYAKNQLMNENIFLALKNSAARLLKCQPFGNLILF